MRTAVFVLALSSLAAPAWATTGTCSGAQDGTPCVDTCIDSGHCGGGACIADQVSANGTACSTGNFCTLGDTCQAGACVPGTAQRVCASAPDSCHVSACLPTVGCTMTLVCLDAGAPPDLVSAPADLATSSSADLATSTPTADAAPPVVVPSPDMTEPAVVIVADMAAPGDAAEPSGPSAPVGSVDMGATPPNGNDKGPYVHGSALGCTVGGAAVDPSLAGILLFVLLLPLRRRPAVARARRQ